MKLTHFQKTVKRALDLTDGTAGKIQPGWPASSDDLENVLFDWNDTLVKKVPGLQMMAAIPIVWSRKPADHSEAEGREVLYHPITGDLIEIGSVFDGLSWEVLAFLHWANRIGRLPWGDGIAIAREAKAAKSIDSLPVDRFAAVGVLPRDDSGGVDWTEPGLSLAKKFVTSGRDLPSPNEGMHFGEDLVGVLCSIPALTNEGTRTSLLRGLPRGPCGAIGRNSAPSTDLNNIVEAAKGFGRLSSGVLAINVIIDNAMRLVRGSALEVKLEKCRI